MSGVTPQSRRADRADRLDGLLGAPVRPARRVERESVQIEVDGHRVEVRRSARRTRTVNAYRDGGQIVVLVPARMPAAEEQRWVREMVGRITRAETRRSRRDPASDDALAARARDLADRYLGGAPYPTSIRWVDNQNTRWGSCTPAHGTIRISRRLEAFPDWVGDYVIVHELAHLQVSGHGPRFWRLVAGYDKAERAQGFLEGVAHGAGLPDAWPTPD